MKTPIRTIRSLALALCLFVFCGGCGGSDGPELATVTGKVTYANAPLANAKVVFAPTEGQWVASGTTDEAGNYHLETAPFGDGAIVGKHRVTIVARAPNMLPPEGTPGRGLPGGMVVLGEPLIPKKYFSAETSGLTAEVKSGGGNEFDFSLTD